MMHPPTHIPPKHARTGFSLMELSVVLGIISLIAGAGMTMAQGALKAADRVTSQERLTTIKLALDSFAKTYGYFPCPFDRALAPTAPAFGRENRTAGSIDCGATNGTSYINAANIITGAVPVRTLGLPDSYAGDAWGNKFTYAVTMNHTNGPPKLATTAGAMTMRYGPTGVGGYNANLQRFSYDYTSVTDPGAGAITFAGGALSDLAPADVVHIRSDTGAVYTGSHIVASVAATSFTIASGLPWTATGTGRVEWQKSGVNTSYVVVSHGPDGRGAFSLAGIIPANKVCNDGVTGTPTSPAPCPLGTDTTCIDIENCDADTTYVDTTYNDGSQAAQYFDDYVVWGSNDLMRTPVNNQVYTSATTQTCPTGVCETWCAACTKNFPGGGALSPPATLVNPVLCKKVISSNATDCKASCFWSGSATGVPPTPHQACP